MIVEIQIWILTNLWIQNRKWFKIFESLNFSNVLFDIRVRRVWAAFHLCSNFLLVFWLIKKRSVLRKFTISLTFYLKFLLNFWSILSTPIMEFFEMNLVRFPFPPSFHLRFNNYCSRLNFKGFKKKRYFSDTFDCVTFESCLSHFGTPISSPPRVNPSLALIM